MKGVKFPTISLMFVGLFAMGCVGSMNPTGNPGPNYPYYVTTAPMVIKNLNVPKGTVLQYEEHFFKEGRQDNMLSEKKLTTIQLPNDVTIDWAGVPVRMIHKFFNTEMSGFSVYPDFSKLVVDKRTKFAELWESCGTDLGVSVKNTDNWSFDKENISDIESCSVLYQRYFKDNTEQQRFLDEILYELMKID